MIEVGRICIKLAGRDAGREAVIVDILENNYVLIDGNVRRRKCNIFHLESTSKKIDIKKGASHEDVKKEFKKLKLPVWETKSKQKGERPKKIRGKKKKTEEAEKKPEDKKKEEKEKKKQEKKKAKEEKKVKKEKLKKLSNVPEGHKKSKAFFRESEKGLGNSKNLQKEVTKEEKPAEKEKKPIDARVISVTKDKKVEK
jgi:large subunit ribosomal protein L14e